MLLSILNRFYFENISLKVVIIKDDSSENKDYGANLVENNN